MTLKEQKAADLMKSHEALHDQYVEAKLLLGRMIKALKSYACVYCKAGDNSDCYGFRSCHALAEIQEAMK